MKALRKNKRIGDSRNKLNRHNALFLFCGVALPLIQFLIFYVYTNFSSIMLAFTGSNGEFTFYNFSRMFKELELATSSLRIAFRNTMITFAIQMVTFPFKVLVSYFIYKKVPGYGLYRIVFFLPTVLFSVCTAMVFTRLVGVNGFIAKAVGEWLNLGYVPELLADSRFANITVLLEMVWLQFPGDLVIWSGTFARIPEEVLESGQIDGTNWWTEFTRIVVPMVWPTVALRMVLLFSGIFSASGSVFLLTRGEYGTMTLSAWQYIKLLDHSGASYSSYGYNYLSAVGLLLTIVAVGISLIVRKITDRYFTDVEF